MIIHSQDLLAVRVSGGATPIFSKNQSGRSKTSPPSPGDRDLLGIYLGRVGQPDLRVYEPWRALGPGRSWAPDAPYSAIDEE